MAGACFSRHIPSPRAAKECPTVARRVGGRVKGECVCRGWSSRFTPRSALSRSAGARITARICLIGARPEPGLCLPEYPFWPPRERITSTITGNMENYARAKQRLFEVPGLKHAVLNLDDVQGARLAELLAGRRPEPRRLQLFRGESPPGGTRGPRRGARDRQCRRRGSAFECQEFPAARRASKAPCLGASTCPICWGPHDDARLRVPFERATAVLAELRPVEGRMQRLGGRRHASRRGRLCTYA